MSDSIREEKGSFCGEVFCPAPEHAFKIAKESVPRLFAEKPTSFKMALNSALTFCEGQSRDVQVLYGALRDVIRDDYSLKAQLEQFCSADRSLHMVEQLQKTPEPKMIGILMEKCKGQSVAPANLCLQWIHAIFEFYYRASHSESLAEQVLKSVEADFPEPVQEGLVFPTRKKPKESKKAKKTSDASSGKASVVSPDSPPTPPAATKQNASSKTLPKAKKSAPVSPVFYIPDTAYVYLAEGSPIVHVSADCPHIRPALGLTIYRATYQRAKYKDYVRVNNITKHISGNFYASEKHCPPICPRCGDFTPILSYRNPKRVYKQW